MHVDVKWREYEYVYVGFPNQKPKLLQLPQRKNDRPGNIRDWHQACHRGSPFALQTNKRCQHARHDTTRRGKYMRIYEQGPDQVGYVIDSAPAVTNRSHTHPTPQRHRSRIMSESVRVDFGQHRAEQTGILHRKSRVSFCPNGKPTNTRTTSSH